MNLQIALIKKRGWKISRGFTIIEMLAAVAISTVVLSTCISLYLSCLSHENMIKKECENTYRNSDIAIDIRSKLSNDSVVSHKIYNNRIESFIKEKMTVKEKNTLRLKNGNLVYENYFIRNNTEFLLKEVIVAKNIESINFYQKGKLIYVKLKQDGVERIIWL